MEAARLPSTGIPEIALNVTGPHSAKPRDEIEVLLRFRWPVLIAAMAVLATLGGAHGSDRNVAVSASKLVARVCSPSRSCLHEFAHALFEPLRVPVLGREEDTADKYRVHRVAARQG